MPEAVFPHAVAAIRLLILTGGRKREILHLHREQVDLEAPELVLPATKTGPRKVSLSPRAVGVLKTIERVPGNPWVIPGRVKGRPMRDIDEAWGGVCELAGLKDTRIHDGRHTLRPVRSLWARISRQSGGLLGHSELQATERYTHLDWDWLHEAAVRISESIARDTLSGCSGAKAAAFRAAPRTIMETEEGTSMRHRLALVGARSPRAA